MYSLVIIDPQANEEFKSYIFEDEKVGRQYLQGMYNKYIKFWGADKEIDGIYYNENDSYSPIDFQDESYYWITLFNGDKIHFYYDKIRDNPDEETDFEIVEELERDEEEYDNDDIIGIIKWKHQGDKFFHTLEVTGKNLENKVDELISEGWKEEEIEVLLY